MTNNNLYVIYSEDYIPERVNARVKAALGSRAQGMKGEQRIGSNEFNDFANTSYRIVYQPGIFKKIGNTKPAVLVGDGFFQWTTFAFLYKIIKKVPLVVCYERTFHTERNAQWYRTLYRKLMIKFIDAMSCNGQLSLEYTKSLGISESRITIGHMVADSKKLVDAFELISVTGKNLLRQKFGQPELAFLAVGRLNERKGIRELIRGWSLLEQNSNEKLMLIIIGNGPLEKELKTLAKRLNLRRVIFYGSVDYNDIARYYAVADVFVMPTLEDNWSLVVPEAMACGLPVICSKYNGCYPELIEPGKNGWIFDPLDKEDTFQALKKCVESKLELKQMGEKSKKIISHHTPQHAAHAILDACNIALKNRKRKQ
jgi:glycosyltransferase involved in cell wall biosynthesis